MRVATDVAVVWGADCNAVDDIFPHAISAEEEKLGSRQGSSSVGESDVCWGVRREKEGERE